MSLRVSTGLDAITEELEHAGDKWRKALDEEAEAENTYRRVLSIAWIQSGNVAATARAKHCENDATVVEARCDWNLALARAKACHSKVEELQSRLMAAMSNQKHLGRVDGGGF